MDIQIRVVTGSMERIKPSIKFWISSMNLDIELKKLSDAAKKMKNDILMEEPCPIYEADEADWEDFWYNEDK